MSLRCTLFDLEDLYKNFFKQNKGYPKYKSKYDRNTYRTNYIKNTYKGKDYENIKLDLVNKTITLPKLIKIRGYRNLNNINEKIINATSEEKIQLLTMYKNIISTYRIPNKLNISGDYEAILNKMALIEQNKKTL